MYVFLFVCGSKTSKSESPNFGCPARKKEWKIRTENPLHQTQISEAVYVRPQRVSTLASFRYVCVIHLSTRNKVEERNYCGMERGYIRGACCRNM